MICKLFERGSVISSAKNECQVKRQLPEKSFQTTSKSSLHLQSPIRLISNPRSPRSGRLDFGIPDCHR
ncbi:hypothetical protein L596_016577 [Steinernema carpocapsae]|uniref:Uncharacterized protein n=1 Tax=Steinernema carpocapsae TaxID=34508 RepID=A0A4U5NJ47_STECR|nr:hypothetical protein L596_016577 [Steinernema carpocapsae]